MHGASSGTTDSPRIGQGTRTDGMCSGINPCGNFGRSPSSVARWPNVSPAATTVPFRAGGPHAFVFSTKHTFGSRVFVYCVIIIRDLITDRYDERPRNICRHALSGRQALLGRDS